MELVLVITIIISISISMSSQGEVRSGSSLQTPIERRAVRRQVPAQAPSIGGPAARDPARGGSS
jgi:hypothetical protein